MAAITITPSTPRRPFANVDASRMRSLKAKMNMKNQPISMSPKRRPLSEVDTENIDPTTLNMSTKRKRGSDEEGHESSKSTFKPPKASRMALTTVETKTAPFKTPLFKPQSPPALKPVGRSPQAKSCKAFARRSTITKSRSELTGRKSVTRPFSIATALGNLKPKSQPTPKTPASWSFDIYVDSEQEEMTNLMQHSTCVLDISDDEGKVDSSIRGKENIPPSELGIDLPHPRQRQSETAATRKNEMTEHRSPLGELNAADYYGEDCHAFSYVVVYDEVDATSEKKASPPLPRTAAPPGRSKLSNVSSISSLPQSTHGKSKSTKAELSETEIEVCEDSSTDESHEGEESSTGADPVSTS